jgi:hypothetical protein
VKCRAGCFNINIINNFMILMIILFININYDIPFHLMMLCVELFLLFCVIFKIFSFINNVLLKIMLF